MSHVPIHAAAMSTKTYRERRDFRRTREPEGGKRQASDRPIFVIQKHDASRLHYDFRLEVDGVLKSWAVPKGPSTDPREKRLATPTEDHPLEYADFEGIIPEGQYGAGTVLVWDTGAYDNVTTQDAEPVRASDALANGHLLVRLHGKKLKGGFVLQRMGKDESADWLLIKIDDDAADARRKPTSTAPRSVVSGRTIAEIAKEERASAAIRENSRSAGTGARGIGRSSDGKRHV
jgi:DNA ligase D-like protein (predicted 3'-phosphoesterase)